MLSTKEKEKSKNSKNDNKEIENKCFVIKTLRLFFQSSNKEISLKLSDVSTIKVIRVGILQNVYRNLCCIILM